MSTFVNERNPKGYVFASVFHSYNIDPDTGEGLAKMLIKDAEYLYAGDLEANLDRFFKWMMNLGLVRIYKKIRKLLMRYLLPSLIV